MSRLTYCLLWILGLALAGCVDRFEPDVSNAPQNYLVVGGFINLAGGTTIQLSRTQNVNNQAAPLAETGATVAVHDESGLLFRLTELTPGTYTSAGTLLGLPAGRKYQVRLRTAAGREYASDLVVAKAAPPIDQVRWEAQGPNVQIYVNARDAANATRYYRWSYTETWEFHSANQSSLEYVNGAMRLRNEDIYHCWGSENSSSILLSTTARLSQDVVSDFPLILLPANSLKLGNKYSVLVRQYAQTPEEYAYWEMLKSNTESLGGLFDPLPSQLTGNVHCLSDATETVIGYVGAGTVAEKRIFIASTELSTIRFQTGYETCLKPDTIYLPTVPVVFGRDILLPLYNVYAPGSNTLIGYAGGTPECTDCRRRGTNQRPAFWQ